MRKKKEVKKKILTQSVEHVHTDHNTGEITKTHNQNVSAYEKEPPYVKLYLQDIGQLNGLTPTEQDLVHELVFNMGYNNIVPSYKPIKESIAHKIGVSLSAINKGIQSLYEKGILIRKARGFYIMDPNLFGRGSWQDISKIKMTIEYNEDGTKSISTSVSKQLGLDFDEHKPVE